MSAETTHAAAPTAMAQADHKKSKSIHHRGKSHQGPHIRSAEIAAEAADHYERHPVSRRKLGVRTSAEMAEALAGPKEGDQRESSKRRKTHRTVFPSENLQPTPFITHNAPRLANTSIHDLPVKTQHRPATDYRVRPTKLLQRDVGMYLVQCLKEVCETRPHDPIEYIAHWLYKSVDAEQYFYEKVIFNKECMMLVLDCQKMQARKMEIIFKINEKMNELQEEINKSRIEYKKLLVRKIGAAHFDTRMYEDNDQRIAQRAEIDATLRMYNEQIAFLENKGKERLVPTKSDEAFFKHPIKPKPIKDEGASDTSKPMTIFEVLKSLKSQSSKRTSVKTEEKTESKSESKSEVKSQDKSEDKSLLKHEDKTEDQTAAEFSDKPEDKYSHDKSPQDEKSVDLLTVRSSEYSLTKKTSSHTKMKKITGKHKKHSVKKHRSKKSVTHKGSSSTNISTVTTLDDSDASEIDQFDVNRRLGRKSTITEMSDVPASSTDASDLTPRRFSGQQLLENKLKGLKIIDVENRKTSLILSEPRLSDYDNLAPIQMESEPHIPRKPRRRSLELKYDPKGRQSLDVVNVDQKRLSLDTIRSVNSLFSTLSPPTPPLMPQARRPSLDRKVSFEQVLPSGTSPSRELTLRRLSTESRITVDTRFSSTDLIPSIHIVPSDGSPPSASTSTSTETASGSKKASSIRSSKQKAQSIEATPDDLASSLVDKRVIFLEESKDDGSDSISEDLSQITDQIWTSSEKRDSTSEDVSQITDQVRTSSVKREPIQKGKKKPPPKKGPPGAKQPKAEKSKPEKSKPQKSKQGKPQAEKPQAEKSEADVPEIEDAEVEMSPSGTIQLAKREKATGAWIYKPAVEAVPSPLNIQHWLQTSKTQLVEREEKEESEDGSKSHEDLQVPSHSYRRDSITFSSIDSREYRRSSRETRTLDFMRKWIRRAREKKEEREAEQKAQAPVFNPGERKYKMNMLMSKPSPMKLIADMLIQSEREVEQRQMMTQEKEAMLRDVMTISDSNLTKPFAGKGKKVKHDEGMMTGMGIKDLYEKDTRQLKIQTEIAAQLNDKLKMARKEALELQNKIKLVQENMGHDEIALEVARAAAELAREKYDEFAAREEEREEELAKMRKHVLHHHKNLNTLKQKIEKTTEKKTFTERKKSLLLARKSRETLQKHMDHLEVLIQGKKEDMDDEEEADEELEKLEAMVVETMADIVRAEDRITEVIETLHLAEDTDLEEFINIAQSEPLDDMLFDLETDIKGMLKELDKKEKAIAFEENSLKLLVEKYEEEQNRFDRGFEEIEALEARIQHAKKEMGTLRKVLLTKKKFTTGLDKEKKKTEEHIKYLNTRAEKEKEMMIKQGIKFPKIQKVITGGDLLKQKVADKTDEATVDVDEALEEAATVQTHEPGTDTDVYQEPETDKEIITKKIMVKKPRTRRTSDEFGRPEEEEDEYEEMEVPEYLLQLSDTDFDYEGLTRSELLDKMEENRRRLSEKQRDFKIKKLVRKPSRRHRQYGDVSSSDSDAASAATAATPGTDGSGPKKDVFMERLIRKQEKMEAKRKQTMKKKVVTRVVKRRVKVTDGSEAEGQDVKQRRLSEGEEGEDRDEGEETEEEVTDVPEETDDEEFSQEEEIYSTSEMSESDYCTWSLKEATITLVCHHPHLGKILARPKKRYNVSDIPSFWNEQNFHQSVFYDGEVYNCGGLSVAEATESKVATAAALKALKKNQLLSKTSPKYSNVSKTPQGSRNSPGRKVTMPSRSTSDMNSPHSK